MEASIHLDFNRRDCFCVWRSTRLPTGGSYRILSLTTEQNEIFYVVANRFQHCPENGIWLGSVFAAKQGLKENDTVFVEIIGTRDNATHASSISILPDSTNDWEILETNQELLIHTFLNQCCCVWPGMKLPLWVGNVYISVIVQGTDDGSPFSVIKEFTEVSVGNPQPADPYKTMAKKVAFNSKVDEIDTDYNFDNAGASSSEKEHLESDRSTSLRVKERRNVISFFVSIMDFIYFLWRGHTYSCRRQMDLIHDSWTKRYVVQNLSETTIHRLNVDSSIQTSWPVVFSSQNSTSIALLQVLPNRCAARTLKSQKQEKVNDDRHSALPVIVSVSPGDDCEPGHLYTNHLCRQMLGASVSDCITMTPLQYDAVHLRSLTLIIDQTKSVETMKLLRRAFFHWMKENFSDEKPLILFPLLVVQLEIDEGESLDCKFDYKFQYSFPRDNVPSFALLSPRMLASGYVRLNVETRSLEETTSDFSQKPHSSMLNENIPEMLETSLLQVCRKSLMENEYAGVIISGPASSGRTVLIRQVVSTLQKDPKLQAHPVWISCRDWRGKAFEKFRRSSSVAFSEAIWRRPSIVVLDDIDALLNSCGSLDHEDDTKETVYASHLNHLFDQILLPSDGVSRLGATIENQISQIILIVSVENDDCLNLINGQILASNGTPLFNCWLNMPSMSEEIVSRVLIPQVFQKSDDFNLNNFIASLGKNISAFSVGDLKFLLEKEAYAPSNQRVKDDKRRNFGIVGGLHDAKTMLTRSVIWTRRYPEIFKKCPLRTQRGVLLFGPSGCGKTLIARSLADEAGVDLIQVRGPELLSKYIGASEANVRDTFARAVRSAPCILFFDDFDALGPRRGHDNTGVTDRVVNQLLTELDGAESQLDDVFIVAASNRPDMIDPALLRPGRLDLHVYCPLPDKSERIEIIDLLCQSELSLSFDIRETKLKVSDRTEGFTGADLRSLLLAARLAGLRRRGLWNIRELWSGDNRELESLEKRNSGVELREEVQMAIELCIEDFDFAFLQVGGTFGESRSQQRAIMENAFLNFHRRHNPETSSETQLRVTLA